MSPCVGYIVHGTKSFLWTVYFEIIITLYDTQKKNVSIKFR